MSKEEYYVIVADDDPSFRNACTKYLQRHGYHTVSAATGKEVIEHLQKESKDCALLILDVFMPDHEGGPATKQDGGYKVAGLVDEMQEKIPIKFITQQRDSITIAEFENFDNYFDHLLKPFTLQKILKNVEDAIALKTTRKAANRL